MLFRNVFFLLFLFVASAEIGVSAHSSKNNQFEQEQSCIICMQGFLSSDEVVKLSCSCKNVQYHKYCISEWIKRSPSCPLCRSSKTKFVKLDNSSSTSNAKKNEKKSDEKLTCVICMDDLSRADAHKLSCSCVSSHYHKECIKRWTRMNNSCPTCRRSGSRDLLIKKALFSSQKEEADLFESPPPYSLVDPLKEEDSPPPYSLVDPLDKEKQKESLSKKSVCKICSKTIAKKSGVKPSCGCNYICHDSCLAERLAYRNTCTICNRKVSGFISENESASDSASSSNDAYNSHFPVCEICSKTIDDSYERVKPSCGCNFVCHDKCLSVRIAYHQGCGICGKPVRGVVSV